MLDPLPINVARPVYALQVVQDLVTEAYLDHVVT